jgi:hypothetical protein
LTLPLDDRSFWLPEVVATIPISDAFSCVLAGHDELAAAL